MTHDLGDYRVRLDRKSRLQSLLEDGRFVVTCELGPPQGADVVPLAQKARMVRDFVDACNLTDCTTAMVRLSSLASSLVVQSEGIEAIMQLTLRDRNRIGLQSDLLGASALGIRNVLCLYGDPPAVGNEKEAKPVYDISTTDFISAIAKMRDGGELMGGGKLTHSPSFFIGAAATPLREDSSIRIANVAKKVDAGAQFIQTQPVFDLEVFEEFISDMRSSGLTQRCSFVAGIMPIKSVRMARHLKEQVHGITLPDEIMHRMEASSSPGPEGMKIANDIIDELRRMRGVSGIHIMTVAWENAIPEIVTQAGLLPRPA